jgi:peptide-methionine (S)-S-oxide reductase
MKEIDMSEVTTILAAGCFWCIEAVFDDLQGIVSVESGYIGGHVDNPTYKQICNGDTGHAEAIRVVYDPAIIPLNEMLDVFFDIHDPTQLNRQGNDVGTQYRSAIFYADTAEKTVAEAAIARAQPNWPQKIVTTLEPATTFYVAEDYHQEYFAREGGGNPYCSYVVAPKLKKFRAKYAQKLKT